MSNNLFCAFATSYAGKCGMFLKPGETFCKRHVGKKEKPKRNKIQNYRGDSAYAKETGMFQGKDEC